MEPWFYVLGTGVGSALAIGIPSIRKLNKRIKQALADNRNTTYFAKYDEIICFTWRCEPITKSNGVTVYDNGYTEWTPIAMSDWKRQAVEYERCIFWNFAKPSIRGERHAARRVVEVEHFAQAHHTFWLPSERQWRIDRCKAIY